MHNMHRVTNNWKLKKKNLENTQQGNVIYQVIMKKPDLFLGILQKEENPKLIYLLNNSDKY